jgi:hypothetical protein
MTFKFMAKQGQHDDVVAALEMLELSPITEKKCNGVLITADLRHSDLTKSQVNKFLHSLSIPGAFSGRKNRKIVKIDGTYDTTSLVKKGLFKRGFKFTASIPWGNRRKLRKARVANDPFGCPCCSPTLGIVLE